MKYEKKCPKCGKQQFYSSYQTWYTAKKSNSKCTTCSRSESDFISRFATIGKNTGENNPFFGKIHSDETKIKLSKKDKSYTKTNSFKKIMSMVTSGKKNPMYGKSFYDIWIKKYGKEEADRRLEHKREKNRIASSGSNNPMYGRPSPHGAGNGWSGWYKGWFFRSLRELSYLIVEIEGKGLVWENAEHKKYLIKYFDYNGNKRTYRPDFFVDNKYLIEVKPDKLKNSKLVRTKQLAAVKFCEKNGWEYQIVSADILPKEKIAELREKKEIIFTKRYEELFNENYKSK